MTEHWGAVAEFVSIIPPPSPTQVDSVEGGGRLIQLKLSSISRITWNTSLCSSKCHNLIEKSTPVLGYRCKPSLSNKQFINYSFIRSFPTLKTLKLLVRNCPIFQWESKNMPFHMFCKYPLFPWNLQVMYTFFLVTR